MPTSNGAKFCNNCRSPRLRTYGLTQDDFNRMCSEQNGQCGICKKTCNALCVDHDHKTNHVRGLLCSKCNMSLGRVEDVDWLSNAQEYLKVHNSTSVVP